jgi:hypothetical protein
MKTITSLLFILISCASFTPQKSFKPGTIWPDNNGVHINAHGGGILDFNGIYYWFGEHKIEGKRGNSAMVGVHCYSSKDLYNWKDEGIALKVSDDTTSLIRKGCVIERPKVIYNKKTKKFVMWFHHELKGKGYAAAMTGVAVSNRVTGPYTWIKSLNPNAGTWPVNFTADQKATKFTEKLKDWSEAWKTAVKQGLFVQRDMEKGQMARDMNLFIDDNGKAYHIHASEENLTLHISELNDDYTGFSGKYITVAPAGHNEAPALFKKDGKYYMITSGCTGWAPNAARLMTAGSVMGEWSYLGNPCRGDKAEITYNSQSTCILPVPGKTGQFIFMADRWVPDNAIDGRYIWLPVQFDEKGIPFLEWKDEWSY